MKKRAFGPAGICVCRGSYASASQDIATYASNRRSTAQHSVEAQHKHSAAQRSAAWRSTWIMFDIAPAFLPSCRSMSLASCTQQALGLISQANAAIGKCMMKSISLASCKQLVVPACQVVCKQNAVLPPQLNQTRRSTEFSIRLTWWAPDSTRPKER